MTKQGADRQVPRWLPIAIISGLTVFVLSVVTFAWINASAPPTPRGYSTFLEDVQAGRVTKVEQEGDSLTVSEGADRFQVVVPSVLTSVYGDMQAAAERGGVPLPPQVYVATMSPDTSWVGLLLAAVLPLALVIVLFGLVILILVRRGGGHPDATSRLRALDGAWKAGLVTDEERERKRTQIIEGI